MHFYSQRSDFRKESQPRMRRFVWLTIGLLTIGATLAACGGPASPGVATGATTTTLTSSSTGGGLQGTSLLPYSSCMRAHGVPNFPDPSSSGGLNKVDVVTALKAVSAAQAKVAQNDCSHLIPPDESLGGQIVHPITTQDQQYYLRAVACIRSHGFPSFPDPVFSGGSVSLPPIPTINTQSPQFIRANTTCKKLIPAGLPDSGNAG